MYRKTFLKALASRSARLVRSRCRLRLRWRSQQSVRTRARRPLSATRAVSARQCRHPVPVALILSNQIKSKQIESNRITVRSNHRSLHSEQLQPQSDRVAPTCVVCCSASSHRPYLYRRFLRNGFQVVAFDYRGTPTPAAIPIPILFTLQ